MRILASILWQRLDLEGHDACLLGETDDGRTLKGHALFVNDAGPCGLAYEVDCDLSWRTRRARVDGFCGMREMRYQIERLADGQWLLNGASQAEVAGLVDVDLGFTPATNLVAIRRLELGAGMAAPAPAAYLAFPELRLSRLEQTYRRLDDSRYAYAAPVYGYDAVLTVSPAGFVLDYPGLWRSAT
ncbi:putative glycolipid-binding domain-containing protein [Mesorhizobium sp. CA16]|uniref:putative glycolipid-binding domain-containing protein n=1 Tax=Mesorhizobium sp. CA16 TaxID=588496 RepID=UPI001CC9FFB2|nr:putative glycolipid-binding domain-containing protein [Mesorhizobium sp. CA16]MBZ9914372.1 putative glycolipid-binding domain-containing protein [Mesorhizobium sp. CA16]